MNKSLSLSLSYLSPAEGELLICGSNNKGQLGLGHRRDLTKLVQIPDLPPMQMVSCGWDHTLGITGK